MIVTQLVKYVIIAAVRDKLFLSLIVSFLLAASLSLFLGDAAVTEKDQFTLIFTASSLRLILSFSLVLFVVFFIRRSFDSRDIDFLLSRPISRAGLVLSYSLGFVIIAIILTLCGSLVIVGIAPHLLGFGHLLWVFTILIETIILVNLAFFFALYISSAVGAIMATLGVYILGRMMGQFLGIIDSALVDSVGLSSMAMQFVSVVTPRFDLLGQSSWLIYGIDGDYGFLYAALQGMVFSALVLLAAILDFIRRQF